MTQIMRSNEEDDRYVAALAMTQLSDLLHDKEKTENGLARGTDASGTLEIQLSSSAGVINLASDGSQLLESPPLDLTLKKKIQNDFVHKMEQEQVCPTFVPCSIDLTQANIFARNIMINTFPNTVESINISQESCPTILIPRILVLPEMKQPQIISIHKTDLKRSKSEACGLDAFYKIKNAPSSPEEDFRAFTPQGLSSISEFIKNNSPKSCSKEQPSSPASNESSLGNLKKSPRPTSDVFYRANFPSGLSSIKEYYKNHSQSPHKRLLGAPKHHPIPKSQKSEEGKTSENEVADAEPFSRVPPLPLFVTEDNSFLDHRRVKSKSNRPGRFACRTNFKARSCQEARGLPVGIGNTSSEGKHPGTSNGANPNASGNSQLYENFPAQDAAERKIPLKVLEMSSMDEASLPSRCKKSKSCAYENLTEAKSAGEHKVHHSPPKEPKKDDRHSGEPQVTYDFLNPDEDGDYILHIAASRGDKDKMDQFLRLMRGQGGDINCRDLLRQTPLHVAVSTSNLGILESLLGEGANPCLPDLKGRSCLHLAVLNGNLPALERLLPCSKKFNCNALDFEGRTALHLASALDDHRSALALVSSQLVNVDAKEGKSGKTALYLSAELNHPRILRLLLEHGASDKEPDYSGYTPYQVAVAKQNDEIIRILDDHQRRNKS